MIFSSPVPQKACTESPKGSRCMLFAGQVMKISCPSVVKRVINLTYDRITLVFNPLMPSGVVHPYKLDLSIFSFRDVWCMFSFFLCISNRNCCMQTI